MATQPSVNLVATALALKEETDRNSPYYKFACWSLYHMLSAQEKHVLKTLKHTATLGVSITGSGAVAKTLRGSIDDIINRLKALEFIQEITQDNDRKRRFTLTHLGQEVYATSKLDAALHVEWYVEQKSIRS